MNLRTKNLRIELLAVLLITLSLGACGKTPQAGLAVQDPWIREAPPNAMALAGYMTLVNGDDQPYKLVMVQSPAFGEIQIHRSFETDGVARMEMQPSLAIPSRNTVTLEPGGYHMMLMQPVKPLRAGDQVEMVLHFHNDNQEDGEEIKGKEISITIPVKKSGG